MKCNYHPALALLCGSVMIICFSLMEERFIPFTTKTYFQHLRVIAHKESWLVIAPVFIQYALVLVRAGPFRTIVSWSISSIMILYAFSITLLFLSSLDFFDKYIISGFAHAGRKLFRRYGWLLAVLGTFHGVIVYLYSRRKVKKSGMCSQCGYFIQHLNVCPECGQATEVIK
jgi:hypothetical protein